MKVYLILFSLTYGCASSLPISEKEIKHFQELKVSFKKHYGFELTNLVKVEYEEYTTSAYGYCIQFKHRERFIRINTKYTYSEAQTNQLLMYCSLSDFYRSEYIKGIYF